ncbi:MAG: hypothetical protein NZO16_04245 [Deltaproteobacteria bacterium]|nr:hypothetical protein [Deltaproteobacteria bacterium]
MSEIPTFRMQPGGHMSPCSAEKQNNGEAESDYDRILGKVLYGNPRLLLVVGEVTKRPGKIRAFLISLAEQHQIISPESVDENAFTRACGHNLFTLEAALMAAKSLLDSPQSPEAKTLKDANWFLTLADKVRNVVLNHYFQDENQDHESNQPLRGRQIQVLVDMLRERGMQDEHIVEHFSSLYIQVIEHQSSASNDLDDVS